jgi:hypothetical protein
VRADVCASAAAGSLRCASAYAALFAEEIFRSKARLSLLAESILQNVIGGARAIIQHENQMGALYRSSMVFSATHLRKLACVSSCAR